MVGRYVRVVVWACEGDGLGIEKRALRDRIESDRIRQGGDRIG